MCKMDRVRSQKKKHLLNKNIFYIKSLTILYVNNLTGGNYSCSSFMDNMVLCIFNLLLPLH